MTATAPRSPVALYVHYPFCASVCPYCDFVVYAGRAARGPDSMAGAVVDALGAEIRLRAARGPLESVYLGGGTPSLMSAAQVERLLGAVDDAFGIAAGAEITIETNPGRGDRGDLAGFRAAGVNRLSVGAQSLDDVELRRLGRRHSPLDVRTTVAAARGAGFANVSLDLLYDVPGQSLDSWRATLDAAIALEPEHVSAYALSLDDHDPVRATGASSDHLPVRPGARRWRERARAAQDDDRAAAMYELADARLANAGYEWYELSNWARPRMASRHNLVYWLGKAWEAVGPGAHAFDGRRTRRWNAARLDQYLAALLPAADSAGRLPPGGSDTADELSAAAEAAILRLRTRFGLPAQTSASPAFRAAIDWADAHRLVERAPDGAVRLNVRGRLLSNEVFARLLPEDAAAAA